MKPVFLDNSISINTNSPSASDGNPYAVRSNAFVSNDLNQLNIIAVNRDRLNSIPLQINGITGYTISNARIYSADTNTSEAINQSAITPDGTGNYLMPPMSILIVEYNHSVVGIQESELNKEGIQLYPNPIEDILHFSETLTNVEIYDSNGQLVIGEVNNTNKISVEHLSSGIYFLKSDKLNTKFIKK